MRLRSLRLVPLAAAVLAAAASGCTRRPAEGLPPGVEVEDLPESESWGVRLAASADGIPGLAIEAPYLARYDRDTAYTYLGPPPGDSAAAPVSLRLFDPEGQPSGSLQAREIWIYEGVGDAPDRIVAQGQVRAARPGRAEVDAARVTMEGERIDAEGGVRASVRGGEARVEARRLAVAADGAFTASGGASVQLAGAGATVRAQSVSGAGSRYTASGGVRVVTSGGRTLEAGRVVWNEAARQFSAPGAFSFDGPGERVRGVGLTASSDLGRYSFRRAAGQIEVRE